MTRVMGVVNVTPDSFSEGGAFGDPAAAIAHARRLVAEGADLIDVGGESTRPGSEPVPEQVELDRVVPVIEALAGTIGGTEISVDTTKPAVAIAAVAAGATVINDVSASLEAVAADQGVGWVAMHSLGPSATMQDDPRYDDVVEEIASFLEDAVARGRSTGVERMWVDPGIGFGKTTVHNLELVANLDRFTAIAPVLIGVSRKRFVGELHAVSDGIAGETPVTPADDRYEGSVAMATWSAHLGADIVRVHDVRGTVHAVRVVNS
ncbi:MAG: dihydropteroate synthase [Acidimicrobiales bacterium]|nr:MAG: dihydropteroate synthase [Acidimicrobiales bacterium]